MHKKFLWSWLFFSILVFIPSGSIAKACFLLFWLYVRASGNLFLLIISRIYLLISHSLTILSKEPEISCCSWVGDHFTDVTHPVCEVRDSDTKAPSEQKQQQNNNHWIFRKISRTSLQICRNVFYTSLVRRKIPILNTCLSPVVSMTHL